MFRLDEALGTLGVRSVDQQGCMNYANYSVSKV
jgi:hypothetical protein